VVNTIVGLTGTIVVCVNTLGPKNGDNPHDEYPTLE